ncbi:MAG: hypothetical protein M3Y77_13730 [Actinomycetota bacterium]|nr:hypothetical protein [Actinomycetota bacterium]
MTATPDVFGHQDNSEEQSAPRPAGRTVSGWMVRVTLAASSVVVVIISLFGGDDIGALSAVGLVLMAIAVLTVTHPGSSASTFLLVGAMFAHLTLDTSTFDIGVGLLVALIPLVHQLSGICAGIPLRSRVDLVVLKPAALRYLVCVVAVEIALVVAVVAGG